MDRAYYRWHPQKPFFILNFTVFEPKDLASRKISGRLYCTEKSLWKLNWFLRDFGYDTDLLGRDEVDEKALLGLTGVLRTNRKSFAGRIFLNLPVPTIFGLSLRAKHNLRKLERSAFHFASILVSTQRQVKRRRHRRVFA